MVSRSAKKRLRVVLMGFGFLCLFIAFTTASGVEETVIASFQDSHPSFKGSGYISLSLIYITFALFNWCAPSVVALAGPKWSLFSSSLFYTLFIAVFLYLFTWSFYTVSVLVGLGAAILWTSQGAYLSMNSDAESISVDSAIFWAMFQGSNGGGLIATFLFEGNDNVTSGERTELFTILLAVSIGANVIFLFLPQKAIENDDECDETQESLSGNKQGDVHDEQGLISTTNSVAAMEHEATEQSENEELGSTENMLSPSTGIQEETTNDNDETKGSSSAGYDRDNNEKRSATAAANDVKVAFVKSMHLFSQKKMLLLFWTFFYSGLVTSFNTGVYSTCLGNTAYWAHSNSYVGLSTVTVGVGQVLACLFGGLSRKVLKLRGVTVVLVGSLVHIVSMFLIFINLPTDAPNATTYATGYINPNEYIAFLCSFLLGFGDGCIQTEIMNILVLSYPEDSAPAFALFKFSQSLSCAVAFFYSGSFNLPTQLGILLGSNIISSTCFFAADCF
ncbi:UNC93-like protein MFSD11 isoform X2 [Convolutriloba macropyga]|uniref:UNC93-like protein MFSD11 isoform X1 n=1 Tax=Convolutriloba macropyga TaxID=536237 RepID=UPI003F527AFA